MNTVFKLVLSLSLSGSLLILVLLLGRPLYRGRVSFRWQYYIWLVVVARLLLPFTPEVSLTGSLFQEAERSAAVQTVPVSAPEEESRTPLPVGSGSAAGPVHPAGSGDVWNAAQVRSAVLENLWVVWLTVALALLLRKFTVYQSFVRCIRAGREEVSDIDRLDQLARLGEQAGVRRPVELYVNRLISSPLLLGLFRPCIVLPAGDLPDPDFQHTLRHELTHCRRRDMAYKWLVQGTVCLHWFNPLVWWMAREISRLCELSCDEAVLRTLNPMERRAYGDTLLRAMGAGGSWRGSPASLPLNESGKLLKERLQAIMAYKKRPRWMTALSAVLAAALLMGAGAAGAYTGPARSRAETVSAQSVKGDPSAAFRYTQEGYCQPPYLFELGWNLGEKAGASYDSTTLSLPGGGSMRVYFGDSCARALEDKETAKALSALLDRLRRETRNTDFPLTRPLLISVRNMGDEDPAVLASRYYEEGALPQFGAVFAQLEEAQQSQRLDRAAADRRTAFQSMLYSKTGGDQALEDMEAALDRAQAEEYAAHGIQKVGSSYYYRDQLVRIFMDQRQSDQSFCTLQINAQGVVDVKVVRDGDNRITGAGPMSREEAAALLEEWDGDRDEYDDRDRDNGWDEYDDRDRDNGWDEYDGWDDEQKQDSAAWGNALDIDIADMKGGEVVWLGEYDLACGDRIRYDVSAEAGKGLEIGFAKPGDTALRVRYFAVSNTRQPGSALRCADDTTFQETSPVKPGRYALFLRATDGNLKGISGKAAVISAGGGESGVVRLSLEDLPAAAAEAADSCAVRTWYVIPYSGRQYIWYSGLAWSVGYQPVRTAEGWRVDIVRLHEKDAGSLLLSVPGEGALELRLDGQLIDYTVVKVKE